MKPTKLLAMMGVLLLVITSCTATPQSTNDDGVVKVERPDPTQKASLTLIHDKVTLEYGDQAPDPFTWILKGYWKDITLPKVDTSKVGSFSLDYEITGRDGTELTKTLTLEVVDSNKPEFIDEVKEVTLKEGEELDLTQFKATDKVDGELTVTLKEGTLDTSKVEEQKAVLVAQDKNNHEVTKEVLVKVEGKESATTLPETSSPTGTPQPSNEPVAVVTPTPTPQPQPQPTPQPSPTPTPTPTPQPSPAPAPTPQPEPTPTPEPVTQVCGGRGGSGVWVSGFELCQGQQPDDGGVAYAAFPFTDAGFAQAETLGDQLFSSWEPTPQGFVQQWRINMFGFTDDVGRYVLIVYYR